MIYTALNEFEVAGQCRRICDDIFNADNAMGIWVRNNYTFDMYSAFKFNTHQHFLYSCSKLAPWRQLIF